MAEFSSSEPIVATTVRADHNALTAREVIAPR